MGQGKLLVHQKIDAHMEKMQAHHHGSTQQTKAQAADAVVEAVGVFACRQSPNQLDKHQNNISWDDINNELHGCVGMRLKVHGLSEQLFGV